MSARSGADGPEDVDATFEQIVAGLRAEGLDTDPDEVERDLAGNADVDDDFDGDFRGNLRGGFREDSRGGSRGDSRGGSREDFGDDSRGDFGDDSRDDFGGADGTGTSRRAPRRGPDASAGYDGADAPGGSGWRAGGTGWDETLFGDDPADDDEHFVPPEPPPLPRPRKGAFVVLLFFVLGIMLLSAPGTVGLGSSVGLPLGLLSLAIGIALSLLRVRQGPPDGADPSNGAQV